MFKEIIKDYAFLNLTEDDLNKIYLEKKQEGKKPRYILNNYIKENIPRDIFNNLLIEKLNKELELTRNPLDMLEGIANFLIRLNYELEMDEIVLLLEKVPIIKEGVI